MTSRRVGWAPVTAAGVLISTATSMGGGPGPARLEPSSSEVIAPPTREDVASYEDDIAVTAVAESVR